MTNRRNTLIVNPLQQRRFIMGIILSTIILINIAVVLGMIFNPHLLDAIASRQIMYLASLEAVTVITIAYFSLILSHRIAGPAHALARDLKRLADGDLTVEIRLRKGDFNLEAAEALNFTAEVLRTRMKTIKLELSKLEASRSIDDATRQTIEQLLLTVAYFKTEPDLGNSQLFTNVSLQHPQILVEIDPPPIGR
jgi:methyl-accepting chemotaxis protein